MNNENEKSTSQEQLRDAIDSIAVIRGVFERAAVNMRALAPLLLCFGGAQILLIFIRPLLFTRMLDMQTYAVVERVVSLLIIAAVFALFIVKRNGLKRTENSYTLKLYDMWGVMLFGLPLLTFAAKLLSVVLEYIAPSLLSENGFIFTSMAEGAMRLAAVCMCVWFTGIVSDKTFLKVVAGVMLAGFVLIYGLKLDFLFGQSLSETGGIAEIAGYISSRCAFANLITYLAYIVLGVCFISGRGGKKDGN